MCDSNFIRDRKEDGGIISNRRKENQGHQRSDPRILEILSCWDICGLEGEYHSGFGNKADHPKDGEELSNPGTICINRPNPLEEEERGTSK
jgi:hypothetical protein